MKRDRWVIFFVIKYFVDGDAMSSCQDIFVFSFGMQLGGVLLKRDWFNRLYSLKIKSFAFIVKSFAFDKWLAGSSRLIEAYLFRILVGLCLDSASRVFPSSSDLHFQIADHLNDHYYILNPTNKPILLYQNPMIDTPQEPTIKITYLKCIKNNLHDGESLNMVCLERTCLENLIGCCACV